MKKGNWKKWLMLVAVVLTTVAGSFTIVSCSTDNEVEDEWDNWQQKNEAMTASWYANSSYTKIKTFSKDESTTGTPGNYIYVLSEQKGAYAEKPMYTDTVRVAYRGRYIPTATYPEGLVFDQSYLGPFSWETMGTVTSVASGFVDGFTTALMNMSIGDQWRVGIPYQLGYGTSSTSVRNYSNLIFDIVLVDFWHPGEKRPSFKARQK